MDLPDKDGRLEILNLHMKNKPLSPDVKVETIAKETFGLSGAHLESLCNEAAILALRKGNEAITQEDLAEALDKVLMGEKLDRLPSPEEIHRVAVHEAGHAVVSESLRPGSVAQVTVSPRGNALGYVRHAPKDDTYVYPRETIEEEICILIAGAASEEMVLGSRSTTASNDFQRALDLARGSCPTECRLWEVDVTRPDPRSWQKPPERYLIAAIAGRRPSSRDTGRI